MEDDRKITWAEIEADVQQSAMKKDRSFSISGNWKLFIRELSDGTKVYSVDGDWVRNNLSIIFGHGGHGLVHEFIPLDEIWVSSKHTQTCECRSVNQDRKVSANYFNSTVLHEFVERRAMLDGDNFWNAHRKALDAERAAGILDDPFTEKY